MKAVCTILGWCTAAAAGGGAGILLELLLEALFDSGAGEFLGRSLDLPLASESEFWLALDDGAGEVISMGSPVLGGDILIVGVGMGITRAPIDSPWEMEVERGKVSVLTAMCAHSLGADAGGMMMYRLEAGRPIAGDVEGLRRRSCRGGVKRQEKRELAVAGG